LAYYFTIFSIGLLRNYKISEVETWQASAIQWEDDACVMAGD